MRWRHPRIEPIELWDAVVGDRTLFAWQRQPDQLPAVLGRLIRQLEDGVARFDDPRPSPVGFPRIDQVYVLGGGALAAPLPPVLPGPGGVAVTVAVDPLFAAAVSGAALAPRAVVADVGQTAVKVSFGGARERRARDFALLPMASELDAHARLELRPAFVDFVAGAMRAVAASAGAGAAVLALPCVLDDELGAGGCSYPYPRIDRTLARDILSAAGLASLPSLVLNDAELAAHAALRDDRMRPDGTTLVLTLGFGVGAALLRARR